MVEIEYLAWAFETRDRDGERWLRSDQEQRQEFSKPAKLRAAARGKFRGKDYGYHCELGGHPVPKAVILLEEDPTISQSLLADMLGHVGRIWDHVVGWAQQKRTEPQSLSEAESCPKNLVSGNLKIRSLAYRLQHNRLRSDSLAFELMC